MLRKPRVSKSEVIKSAEPDPKKEDAAVPRTTMTTQTKPPRLLIHCEGETEKQYLSALTDALQIQNYVSIRKTAACDPMSLLEAAYKDYQWSQVADLAFPFTEYWLVFDRDHHQTYDDAFKMATHLAPAPHLCWTNPCIEFWFWLHYTDDITQLRFDERTEIFHKEEQKDLGNGILEITTVRRLQKSVTPETMLKHLKAKCKSYSKVRCPPDLIAKSVTACDHLKKAAQSENPYAMGSAMPSLLLRLADLSEMLHPKKEALPPATATPAASSDAPDEPASPLCKLQTKIPEDPCAVFTASLRLCLADWPHITVTESGLSAPPDALKHLEDFFSTVAHSKTDSKTRVRGQYGLNCLQNLNKLLKTNLQKANRLSRLVGKLTVLGQSLAFYAKSSGLSEEIQHLDLSKPIVNLPPADTTELPPAVKEEVPPLSEVDDSFTEMETTPDPQTLLTEKRQALKSLQSRFRTALACITVSDPGAPQEMLPGVCEKAALLMTEATVLINSVTAILTDGTDDVPPESPDVFQAMWDDYNAYLEYGRD